MEMQLADSINDVCPKAPEGRSVECFQSDLEGRRAFLFSVSHIEGNKGDLSVMKITHEEMKALGFTWNQPQ